MSDTKVTNNNGYGPGWIASLRAAASEADALRATVAEQARQIEAARKALLEMIGAMHAYEMDIDDEPTKSHIDMMQRAWLAANAPTPAPEASTAPHFATVQKYREALEQIERVWIDESIADEHVAALKMYTTAARVLNNADDETDNATEAEQERTP